LDEKDPDVDGKVAYFAENETKRAAVLGFN